MLDPADSYGSTWASLSGADFVHKFLRSSLSSHIGGHQQQPTADAQQQSGATGDACSTAVGQQDSSTGQQQQQQQQDLKIVQDCSIYMHPSLEQALDNKGLIIDLAPRVSWGDERNAGNNTEAAPHMHAFA